VSDKDQQFIRLGGASMAVWALLAPLFADASKSVAAIIDRRLTLIKFLVSCGLSIACLKQAVAGGPDTRLLSWIGFCALLYAVWLACLYVAGLSRFREPEHIDHKQLPPDTNDWFHQL
jgi:hypothetical protein